MKEMQLKAFVKMCVVCYVWCLLVNVVVVVVFFHFSQRTKGAKCLQTLHNINRLVGRCCFFVCVCAMARHLVRLSVLSRFALIVT